MVMCEFSIAGSPSRSLLLLLLLVALQLMLPISYGATEVAAPAVLAAAEQTPEQLLSVCVDDLSGFRDSCVELSQTACSSVRLAGRLVVNEHVACPFELQTQLATLDEKDGLIGCTACDGGQFDDQQCQVCFYVEDGDAVASARSSALLTDTVAAKSDDTVAAKSDDTVAAKSDAVLERDSSHSSPSPSPAAAFYPGGCLVSQLHCGSKQTPIYGSRTAIGCFAMEQCQGMNECLGGCGGHGTCKMAHCNCNKNFYGTDCSTEIRSGCLSTPRLLGGPLCVETHLEGCEELSIRLDLHDDTVVYEATLDVHTLLARDPYLLWCGQDSEESGACRLCVSVTGVRATSKHVLGNFEVSMQCPETPNKMESWTLGSFSETLPKNCNLHECLNDCSDHGSCSKGVCTCDAPWGGIDCSEELTQGGSCLFSSTYQNKLCVDVTVKDCNFPVATLKEGSVELGQWRFDAVPDGQPRSTPRRCTSTDSECEVCVNLENVLQSATDFKITATPVLSLLECDSANTWRLAPVQLQGCASSECAATTLKRVQPVLPFHRNPITVQSPRDDRILFRIALPPDASSLLAYFEPLPQSSSSNPQVRIYSSGFHCSAASNSLFAIDSTITRTLEDHCQATVAEESEYELYVDCASEWCAFRFWVEYRPIVSLPLGETVVLELPNVNDAAYFSFHRHGEISSFALEVSTILPTGSDSAPEISLVVDRLQCPTAQNFNPSYVAEVTHRTDPAVEVHTVSFVSQPAGEYFALLTAKEPLVYVEVRLLELGNDDASWDSPSDDQPGDSSSSGSHVSTEILLAGAAILICILFGVTLVVVYRKRPELFDRCRRGRDSDLEGGSYSQVSVEEDNQNEADQWFSRFLGADDELVSSDDE
eukprot:CAMPEP_0174246604 /NCGR_PEP_ID=MMETSP0417-20130205/42155_1 /TAXON_ID=242541 /ORGANISM="Mayorella sp, Strain BSH-02190019" /LENGTH=877 /DNA_ID=CAMNT_0015326457 /DNA_START=154 /DNA_END=2787 /DNA_ORIENTATION=-